MTPADWSGAISPFSRPRSHSQQAQQGALLHQRQRLMPPLHQPAPPLAAQRPNPASKKSRSTFRRPIYS